MSGHILALSGGVGGAKLAAGLAAVLSPERLTIAVNTGDDFEHLGLTICPDIDSVVYALAGLNDTVRGWGVVETVLRSVMGARCGRWRCDASGWWLVVGGWAAPVQRRRLRRPSAGEQAAITNHQPPITRRRSRRR